MQTYADVTRRPLSLLDSAQGPALGSAIHAAVAAGAYPDVFAASEAMGRKREAVFVPDPDRALAYDALYAEYTRLHDAFGPDDGSLGGLMHRLRAIKREAGTAERHGRAAASVAQLNIDLLRWGLVTWTSGNVSARLPDSNLLVIKPSGVSFDDLTPESMVVCDLDGNLVEGELAPSSDTAAHAYVYRAMPDVGGVVHTHSTYATAWAARAEEIPCVLTAMADEFGGADPGGAVRPGRQRGHRQGHRLDPQWLPVARGADAQPRRLHDRPDGQGGGQGRRHVRGRRAHRPSRPSAG